MQTLTDKQVAAILAVSRGYVWKLVRVDPTFPKPFNVGLGEEKTRARRWDKADIETWLQARKAATSYIPEGEAVT